MNKTIERCIPLAGDLLSSCLKTEQACGLLWNAILSLWLSPQDFHPSFLDSPDMAQTGMKGTARLGENHARVYAKACEVKQNNP